MQDTSKAELMSCLTPRHGCLPSVAFAVLRYTMIYDQQGRILGATQGMLKLTKKADYGLMAMKHLAERADEGACSAKDVAEAYGLPQEAVAKILQRLAKSGLLRSRHGIN